MDQWRGVKIPKFQVGGCVRVRKAGKMRKGEEAFRPPLRIVERMGRWTCKFHDRGIWNSFKLTVATPPKQRIGNKLPHAVTRSFKGAPASSTTRAVQQTVILSTSGKHPDSGRMLSANSSSYDRKHPSFPIMPGT